MRAKLILLGLGAAALVGCQREAGPTPADAAAAAVVKSETTSVTDFSKPMMARGNEPFWAVKMEGQRLTLSRPGQPDQVFEAPGATIQPGRGVWQAKSADGKAMTVSLYMSDCSDGMSDMRYPMTAEVALATETLRGCAAKLADMPKEAAPG